MTIRYPVLLICCLIALAFGSLAKVAAQEQNRNGRYLILNYNDGILWLDTRLGYTSFCKLQAGLWSCQELPIRFEYRQKSDVMPLSDSASSDSASEDNGNSDTPAKPTDDLSENTTKTLNFMDKVIRRFFAIINEIEQENKARYRKKDQSSP